MNKPYFFFLISVLLSCNPVFSQIKILFDATKAETASNADWVISNSSSPQQIPSPAQSGITSTTAETYWVGGISSWGVDCVKQGYYVETLPSSGKITYGVSSNLQDLSRYKVFVVCEPNSQFSATEKDAIINFVKNGGGLFMVSDHDVSDRNSDGWDSPHIWNDLLTTNTVETNPFGISFDYANISGASLNLASVSNDSILNGKMGKVAEAEWFNGTTMTLTPAKNATVKGEIYTTGSANTGITNVMFATAKYGKGKVAAIGDSSPCDDGTGGSGNTLYDGYWTDAAGNHRPLLMNATIWLATSKPATGTAVDEIEANALDLNVFPTPVKDGKLYVSFSSIDEKPFSVQLIDLQGKILMEKSLFISSVGLQSATVDISTVKPGAYLLKISNSTVVVTKKIVVSE
jgi:hypothetical protein